MATDTYTTGKLGLIEPGAGNYVDSWAQPLYANWQTLDAAVSGTTTITLSNLNVVLVVPTYPTYVNPPSTANSTQNMRLLLLGALTANVSVQIPAGVSGQWIVDNRTTGNYSVTIKTTSVGSTGVNPVQSFATSLYSDGANVYYSDAGSIVSLVPQGVPSGSIMAYAGPTIPANWLYCDGSSYTSTQYPNLYAAIGNVWGGSGSTFNVPNLIGVFMRGAGGTFGASLGQYQADSYLNHSHTATSTDSGHTHPFHYTGPNANGGGDGWLVNTNYPGTINTLTGFAQITTTVATSTTGGTENRPKSYSVYYMIKT